MPTLVGKIAMPQLSYSVSFLIVVCSVFSRSLSSMDNEGNPIPTSGTGSGEPLFVQFFTCYR